MDETVTVTKSEWEALQERCSEAEERASIEAQLRKAVTEEMRKLQRKYAAQSAAPSNGELAATRARLRYLLKSEIVRLYDEVSPQTGFHRFNLSGLDACFLYAFDKTFDTEEEQYAD